MYWMAKKKGEAAEKEQEMQKQLVVLGGDPHCHDVGGSGVEVEENKIFFYCGVGSKEVLELNRAIMRLDSDMQIVGLKLGIQPPPIELHIHSDGGSAFSGMAAMDAILRSKTPIHTYIDGSAASAATLMSVAGAKRFINKNSFILIHQLSTFVSGKYEEFKDEIRNQELLMDSIKQVYRERSKMTEEQILSLERLYSDAMLPLQQGSSPSDHYDTSKGPNDQEPNSLNLQRLLAAQNMLDPVIPSDKSF